MDSIHFAPISEEAAETLPHESLDFTEVHEQSNLDLTYYEITGDLYVNFTKRVGMIFGFIYDDYTDDDPYLVDSTGTYYWVWTGIKLTF